MREPITVRLKSGRKELLTADLVARCNNRDADGNALDDKAEEVEVIARWVKYLPPEGREEVDPAYAQESERVRKLQMKKKIEEEKDALIDAEIANKLEAEKEIKKVEPVKKASVKKLFKKKGKK